MTTVETDRLTHPIGRDSASDLQSPSPRRVMRRRALTHPGFLVGCGILAMTIFVAVFAPLLTPYDPYAQSLSHRLIPPVWSAKGGWDHLLGTDGLGRDYLTRLMYGARVSLTVGIGAASMAGFIGTSLGLIGGYFGGKIDAVVMYIVNVKLALPGLLVALSLISVFGGSLFVVVAVLGALFWDRFVVVTRTVTQQVRVNDYVTAAEALGASRLRIIVGEILPNVLNQIIVVASLEMAVAILVEAALSFLGLGIRPPTPSWGLMISEGRNFMFFQPYLVTIPGIAILVLVIGVNMLGDGVRDITAPEGPQLTDAPALRIEALSVAIDVPAGVLHAVTDVDIHVDPGETLCIVGESGCGKTMTALAVMGLLPRRARMTARRIELEGRDLVAAGPGQLASLRGDRIAMIFQDPMTSLNPVYTIGNQMEEVHLRHRTGGRKEARERAEHLLAKVGIAAPRSRLGQYPHQLSGGLRQRVMIAMALMCGPVVIIADEPTTALDVTLQAQILHLLADLQAEYRMALVLITHDLGVVARMADRVVVMYAGQVAETGSVAEVFSAPLHPYTQGLIDCIPIPGRRAPGSMLGSIPGLVPSLIGTLDGCSFRGRCAHAFADCAAAPVPLREHGPGRAARCLLEDRAP